MQSLEIIRSYLKKREKTIGELLTKKHKTDAPENFHQLRVEIKKTRAALTLLSTCASSLDLKQKMAPYRDLFKQAGKIRELQLHQTYLHKHSGAKEMPVYNKTLEEQTSEEIKRFSALKKQKEIRSIAHNSGSLRLSPFNINDTTLENTLEREQETIVKLLAKSKLKVPQMHDLRKRIKRFHFLSTLIPLKTKKLKGLDEFQELLGKWHDYEVFGEELQKADKLQNIPIEEKKKIRKLKPKVVQKRETLFKKIDKSRFSLIKN